MNDMEFAALARERGEKLRQKTQKRRTALISAATLAAALILVFGIIRLTNSRPPQFAAIEQSGPAADSAGIGKDLPQEPLGEEKATSPTEVVSRAAEAFRAEATTGEAEHDAPTPALTVYAVSAASPEGSASNVAGNRLGAFPEDVAKDVKARLDALIAANQYNFTDAAGETGPGILLVFSTGESYTLLPGGTIIARDDACTLSPDAVDGIYAALGLE